MAAGVEGLWLFPLALGHMACFCIILGPLLRLTLQFHVFVLLQCPRSALSGTPHAPRLFPIRRPVSMSPVRAMGPFCNQVSLEGPVALYSSDADLLVFLVSVCSM